MAFLARVRCALLTMATLSVVGGIAPDLAVAEERQERKDSISQEREIPSNDVEPTPKETDASDSDGSEPPPPGDEPAVPEHPIRRVRSSEGVVDEATTPAPEASMDDEALLHPEDEVEDTHPSALTDFSEPLAPYGRWVEHPRYGTVWVPDDTQVGADFAPYVTGGRWAFTPDDQWIWVSDYPFGWVVFHYGRWVWTQQFGWSWVPGRRYAHAWVTFRTTSYGDPYLGWAPLPPRYIWRNGRVVWLSMYPPTPYVFVPAPSVFSLGVSGYVVRDRYAVQSLAHRSRRYRPHGVRGYGALRYYPGPPLHVLRIGRAHRPVERVPAHPRAVAMRRASSSRSSTELRTPRASGPVPRPPRTISVPRSTKPRAAPRRLLGVPSQRIAPRANAGARPRSSPARLQPAAPRPATKRAKKLRRLQEARPRRATPPRPRGRVPAATPRPRGRVPASPRRVPSRSR